MNSSERELSDTRELNAKLRKAVKNGDCEALLRCVSAGADIKDKELLLVAIEHEQVEICQLLVNEGVPIDYPQVQRLADYTENERIIAWKDDLIEHADKQEKEDEVAYWDVHNEDDGEPD